MVKWMIGLLFITSGLRCTKVREFVNRVAKKSIQITILLKKSTMMTGIWWWVMMCLRILILNILHLPALLPSWRTCLVWIMQEKLYYTSCWTDSKFCLTSLKLYPFLDTSARVQWLLNVFQELSGIVLKVCWVLPEWSQFSKSITHSSFLGGRSVIRSCVFQGFLVIL